MGGVWGPNMYRRSGLRIVGPASRVALIDTAETDPVDLTGFEGLLVTRVHSYIADSQVRFESPPMVEVRVERERIRNNQ